MASNQSSESNESNEDQAITSSPYEYDSDEGDPQGHGLNFLDFNYYIEPKPKQVVNQWVDEKHPPPNEAGSMIDLMQSMRANGSLVYSDRTARKGREVFRLFCYKIENMIRLFRMDEVVENLGERDMSFCEECSETPCTWSVFGRACILCVKSYYSSIHPNDLTEHQRYLARTMIYFIMSRLKYGFPRYISHAMPDQCTRAGAEREYPRRFEDQSRNNRRVRRRLPVPVPDFDLP